MADIYGAKSAIGGIFKGTAVKLTLGLAGGVQSGGLTGSMVQTISLSYSRNVTRVWELGSDDTYYVIGRAEGQAQLARIVAKKNEDLLDVLGDACKAKNALLKLTSEANGCEANPGISLTMSGPMLHQRGFSIDVNQFVMSSTAAIMFSGLDKA